MAIDRSPRERRALLGLTKMLAGESSGGVLGEVLEHLVLGVGASAGAAFAVRDGMVDLLAEHASRPLVRREGKGSMSPRAPFTRAAAEHAGARRVTHFRDLATAPIDDAMRAELGGFGFGTMLVAPVVVRRETTGLFILAGRDAGEIDAGSAEFAEIVVHIVALAAERHDQLEREAVYKSDLIDASRMASLGMLTVTVAHELRGPIAALSLQAEEERRLADELRAMADGSEDVLAAADDLGGLADDFTASVERVRATISQLSGLARRDDRVEPIDVGDLATEAVELTRAAATRASVRLVVENDAPATVQGRRQDLVQVVLNLVLNAIDACAATRSGGGEVRVRTGVESGRVVLAVEDTGPGVPPELVSSIFQPFFTTKERGRGTGLGLKICSDVVSEHHGHVEVVDAPGGGACFRVILPRSSMASEPAALLGRRPPSDGAPARAKARPGSDGAPPPASARRLASKAAPHDEPRARPTAPALLSRDSEAARSLPPSSPIPNEPTAPAIPPPPAPPTSARGARGSMSPSARDAGGDRRAILLIDDDEVFARTMRRALRPHEVRVATSVAEAEAALSEAGYQPDVVLCDLGLPGAGGDVLHARTRAERPDLAARFVFVTGGACTKAAADYLRTSGCPTLLKPVDLPTLLAALDSTAPAASMPRPLKTLMPPADDADEKRRVGE